MEFVSRSGTKLLEVLLKAPDPRDGDLLCSPFLRLPNKRQYPDYYEIIKRPLTLEDIRTKLMQRAYKSFGEVKHDCEIVCMNAKRYNMKDSEIWLKAKDLHLLIKETYADLLVESQPENGLQSPKKEEQPMDIGRSPKARSRPLRRKDGPYQMQAMKKQQKREYPEYYKVIQKPISLAEIEARLANKGYINPHALFADLGLMLDNAQFFNEEGSQVWNDAQEMRGYLETVSIPALLAEGFTMDPDDLRQSALPLHLAANSTIPAHTAAYRNIMARHRGDHSDIFDSSASPEASTSQLRLGIRNSFAPAPGLSQPMAPVSHANPMQAPPPSILSQQDLPSQQILSPAPVLQSSLSSMDQSPVAGRPSRLIRQSSRLTHVEGKSPLAQPSPMTRSIEAIESNPQPQHSPTKHGNGIQGTPPRRLPTIETRSGAETHARLLQSSSTLALRQTLSENRLSSRTGGVASNSSFLVGQLYRMENRTPLVEVIRLEPFKDSNLGRAVRCGPDVILRNCKFTVRVVVAAAAAGIGAQSRIDEENNRIWPWKTRLRLNGIEVSGVWSKISSVGKSGKEGESPSAALVETKTVRHMMCSTLLRPKKGMNLFDIEISVDPECRILQ
ncbi:Bromodomain-containing protein [Violaceomyces palustris]|uniref:Bromodomain-containing protein n=1 Tax=Violaceomyces palustris TaxID=1673888 RepID=A0ACD0P821_9BASI|nr:Bromodomain-containing protein [Violaceomyces palustris]